MQVGDGMKTNIFSDNYNPSSHNLKTQTSRGHIMVSKFSDLIKQVDFTWDDRMSN